ncbi:hypothetical protein [Rhodoferax sp.]|uniref:hypothetical protein n=1 Tax=Rhodoferax sp. TaxID=50421 RepID=UPI0028469BCA|nr:hypothetical protein [Rhodoferax sp.]MDR3371186.1 hypothetical protein [Rhodoferax sp.]
MIKKCSLIISIFIASSAVLTRATAENIYKCGDAYSQSPCPGGKLLNIDDSRDPQQKLQQDAATQRDAELAKEMERSRLANEAALRATEAKNHVAHKPKSAASEPTVVIIKPKRPRHQVTKPKDFTALVPGTAHQPTKKRSVKKPELDRQPG